MKKVIAWLLVLALTAAISIGATLAYLTDTDEDVNVMTLGKVKIDQLEYERIDDETANQDAKVQEFHDNKPLYPAITGNGFDYTPGDTYVDWAQIGKDGYTDQIWNPESINNELDKMVFIKNKGDYDAFVRSVFAFEAGKYTTLDQFKSMVHLNLNTTDWTWEWTATPVTIGASTYFVATATYNKVLVPGALTEISLAQIALDKTGTNADVKAFGDTYQILVKSQGIQADGFDKAAMALDEGFGPVDETNIPWDSDAATTGTKLKSTLRYINGDKSLDSRKLTKNVIIDNIDKYPQITANYKATLVDELQDVPVYVYYVPNGDGYDIYALSSDKVYADNCYSLFYNWANLETVYCPALDTSRVTDSRFSYMFTYCNKLTSVYPTQWDTSMATTMYAMFGECAKLESMDVTTWDTSNVTDVRCLFLRCRALEELTGSGNMDLSKVTDLYCMFEGCDVLSYLDVTNWGLDSVQTMTNTFAWCYELTALEGCENWNLSNVTSMPSTFAYDHKLSDLDCSTWDTSSCTNMSLLFKGCRGFETLAVENWNVSNVTEFNSMFSGDGHNAGDMNLTHLDLSKWDMSSAVKINHMFYGCGDLKEIDLSGWDVRNVHDMNHMFADCYNLEKIDFTGWQTDNLANMDCVFNNCEALKSIDLSMFDTSKVTYMCQMFESCKSLEEVIGLENFDTSKVTDFSEMFTATKLTKLDLSSFDTSSATIVYSMFNNNPLLETIYVGDGWDMSKVTSSSNMFSGCGKLTGGNGTTTSGNPTDATYARVDTPEAPGYLTYKAPATTNP